MNVRSFVKRCGAIGVVVLSGLGLIAYIPGLGLLGSFSPDFIPMAPSTAVTFLICGGCLLLETRIRAKRPFMAVSNAFLAVTALFGFLAVIGSVIQIDLNFENRIMPDFGLHNNVPVARMSPFTGALFFTAASAMLMRLAALAPSRRNRRWGDAAGMLSTMTLAGGLTFLLGYLYGTPLLYNTPTIPMAFTTAMGFVFLGAGLVAAGGAEYFPVSQFWGTSTRSRLMRAFFPLCIGAMLVQGIVSRILESTLAINDALSSAALLVVFSGITAIVVLQMSRLIGNQIDSSEARRRQAEHSLAMEKEQLAVTLRSIGDGVITTDINGRITLINTVAEALTGWKQHEAVGSPLSDIFRIVDEKTRKPCANPVERVLKTNGIIGLANGTLLIARDGAERILADSGAPIRDKEGRIFGVVLVFRDITADVEMEGELRQAHKMDAIGTLAGGIAHEFNNVLSIIMGNAELALDILSAGEKARWNLDQILVACFRVRDVVRQLLNFSRKTVAECVPIEIANLVRETLKLIRASTPTTIELKAEIPDKVDVITADPIQIHQLLINLCTNATHAMGDDGGVLEIRLENVFVDETLASVLPDIQPGPHIRLRLSDTGTGIDPPVRQKIFDPYFTTKEVGKGTGMGLAVVHGIVKNHKGAITVDSNVGKGTTFTVYLPATEGTVATKAGEAKGMLPKGRERILLVDDEPALVNMGKTILGRLGYQVIGEIHAADALNRIRTAPDAFDLVITDMNMPELPGDKLAEAILAIRPDLPIVICTGYSERLDEEKARIIGIRDCLQKPISTAEIASVIRRVLDAE